jgi:hypothetical protein
MRTQAEKAKGSSYNWVLILGGTNDIGWGRSADAIFDSLQRMYRVSERVYCLLVTQCGHRRASHGQGRGTRGQG